MGNSQYKYGISDEEGKASVLQVDELKFSQTAHEAIRLTINKYIADLTEQSSRAARMDSSDIISTKHVEYASRLLRSGVFTKTNNKLGTLGGLLMGTCLSNIYPLATSQAISASGFWITLISGVAGAVLLTVGFIKE